jgi:hypothetical protein
MRRALDDYREQPYVEVRVVEALARRLGDIRVVEEHFPRVRTEKVERVLIPWHLGNSVTNARSHREQIPNRNRIEAAVSQFGQVIGDRIVESLDVAFVDCTADQSGGERLRHGTRNAHRVTLITVEIALV